MSANEPVPFTPQKLRIFIDFWNFQLALNEATHPGYRPDWKKLPTWLMQKAISLIPAGSLNQFQFEGTHIYLSFDPKSPKDAKLREWANNTLNRFPGIHVTSKERKWKSYPVCPVCHRDISQCPHCGSPIQRTAEKGIDTAIVTDMIKLAWEDAWHVAVLVSSDRDFIPAVEFLSAKGHKVINANFLPRGFELARTCWASIDLTPHIAEFERVD